MKSIKFLSMLAISATLFVSCGSDDDSPGKKEDKPDTPQTFKADDLKGDITADYTLKAGVEYKITGQLHVKAPAILTIEPGTIITAKSGAANVYLAVERGAKLMAEGTADKPIVFKSASPTPGTGDWGGVVIAGKAKTNKVEAESEVAGLKYGGKDDADNSGVLTYVKMSHTGAKISGTNEFNGLSLYSVGSATKIENIFISNGADDGIEFFGGTVNVTNLICVNIKDDMFDFTEGYTGTIKNAFGVREAGFNEATKDPRGIEGDSNGGNNGALPISEPTFDGVTILNISEGQKLKAGAEIRRGTKATINNALFATVGNAEIGNLIDTKDDEGNGELTITNSFKSGSEIGDNKVGGTITGTVNEDADAVIITGDVVTTKAGLGADFSKFAWTKYTVKK